MTDAAGARRIVARVLATLAGASLGAGAAGCTEQPQLLVPDGEPAIERLERDGELRERTLHQGESERMR